MNNSVKQMIQMQSKSIKSAIHLHPAVCDLRCMRNKSTVVVLVQKKENHNITFKQQMRDYITTYRQLDTKALYRLDISSLPFFRQQVEFMVVLFICISVQLVFHETCDAMMNFRKGLTEYGQFQGSWSVPRSSGSQVKFWLKVDNDKLDPMQFSGKLVKDVEQVKENELGKQLKFRNIFLFLWDCLSRNYEGFPRRHVPSLASGNLSQAFGCV